MKNYLLIGILLAIVSCRPIKSTRNRFANTQFCYNGTDVGLQSKININGYYSFYETYMANRGTPSVAIKSTYQINFLFMVDGIFIYNYNVKSQDGFWGRYVISSDTIKAQFIEDPGGMSWSMNQIWFIIKDSNHLEKLYYGSPENITSEEIKQYQKKRREEKDETSLGEFVPLDTLPNSDKSWLKKREWFWCDKAKFKEWKKKTKPI